MPKPTSIPSFPSGEILPLLLTLLAAPPVFVAVDMDSALTVVEAVGELVVAGCTTVTKDVGDVDCSKLKSASTISNHKTPRLKGITYALLPSFKVQTPILARRIPRAHQRLFRIAIRIKEKPTSRIVIRKLVGISLAGS
jgi:hypothetical protein